MLILTRIILSMSKQTIFPLGMVYTLHSVVVKISQYLWCILLWIRNYSLLVVIQTGITNITTILSVSFCSLLMRSLRLVILLNIIIALLTTLVRVAFLSLLFQHCALVFSLVSGLQNCCFIFNMKLRQFLLVSCLHALTIG